MDANQFDELVSRLVDGPSRRDALKGLAGGALATGGIGASLIAAEGKKRKARKSRVFPRPPLLVPLRPPFGDGPRSSRTKV